MPSADKRAAELQALVDRQAAEIESLRRQLADQHLAADLRDALALATSAGTIAAPTTYARLLELIVETAGQVIGAQAGSLFLIDEDTSELVFEVALGQKADEVKKFRVPLGQGIAGLVAVSGQPMVVSDVANDPRRAAGIQQSIGYTPQSILCVPLFFDEQVMGVLELLDKVGAPSFTMADTNALSLFASIAAVAIEQSRANRNLGLLLAEALLSLGSHPDQQRRDLSTRAREYAVRTAADDRVYRDAVDLAALVRDIVWHGERETAACRTLLTGFAEYLGTRPTGIEAHR